MEEVLSRGTPEIFNTDQGAQFTGEAFTGLLKERGIQISHDGKGRYLDNIFVERLWRRARALRRSLKYEEVVPEGLYAGPGGPSGHRALPVVL
ncbi:MAG: hypothetical protein Q7T26_06640 [Dehalococcoidia bacterium]|nr:hypothetical protein [Dehalococcoidia bacterium]